MLKKVVFIIVFLFAEETVFAQDEALSSKKTTFGFNLGLNRTKLDYESINAIIESKEVGFRIGVLAEHNFNKSLFVSPKAELSFYQNTLEINMASDYEIMPVSIDVMAHLGYKFLDSQLRPYLFFGPSFKLPIEREDNKTDAFKTNSDLAIDIGVGIERNFTHFFFAPEFRYSYGLFDVNNNPALQNVYIHNISLVLNFKG